MWNELIKVVKYLSLSQDPTRETLLGPDCFELEVEGDLGGDGAGGDVVLWLGVWEFNYRAVDFYKQWGFALCGSHPFLLGDDLQTDILMELKL